LPEDHRYGWSRILSFGHSDKKVPSPLFFGDKRRHFGAVLAWCGHSKDKRNGRGFSLCLTRVYSHSAVLNPDVWRAALQAPSVKQSDHQNQPHIPSEHCSLTEKVMRSLNPNYLAGLL